MVTKPPSNGETADLHLKGTNYNTGKAINWDDKVDYGGIGNQRKWDFNVFQSGGIRIDEKDGAHHGGEGAGNFTCDQKNVFQVTKPTYEGGDRSWTDDASKIKFELKNCSNKSKGRQICDIEIEGEKKFILKPHPSLSFKSDVVSKAPSDGKKDDLYLKGQYYHSGKKIDFDETYDLEVPSGRGPKKEHRWRLTAFESGTTQLGEIGGGETDLGGYGEDEITCDRGKFEVTTPTDRNLNKWEKLLLSLKQDLLKY